MGDRFDLLGSPPAVDGGEVSSDESTNAGSKNNYGITVEVSSPFHAVVGADENLELGLGLSVGGGGGGCSGGDDGGNSSAFVSPVSMVGWPPVRRCHRLANQTKPPQEQSGSDPQSNKTLNPNIWSDENQVENGYRPVKVPMDGMLIGRKVDLCAHNSYETLAKTLQDMFFQKEEEAGHLNLLDAKSEFVVTYEDKNGNHMLLGVVPWRMFLSSVKRLRITRNSKSNTVGDRKRVIESPTCQEKKTRRNRGGV